MVVGFAGHSFVYLKDCHMMSSFLFGAALGPVGNSDGEADIGTWNWVTSPPFEPRKT